MDIDLDNCDTDPLQITNDESPTTDDILSSPEMFTVKASYHNESSPNQVPFKSNLTNQIESNSSSDFIPYKNTENSSLTKLKIASKNQIKSPTFYVERSFYDHHPKKLLLNLAHLNVL